MLSGNSSQVGILFGDPALEGDNAVYCRRSSKLSKASSPVDPSASSSLSVSSSGDLCLIVGKYDEVKELFWADQRADYLKSEKDPHGRLMLKLTAFALAFIAVIALLFDGAPVFGALVFAVVGWFPAYVLLSGKYHGFRTDEMFEQLRRHHGAEHAVFHAYNRKNKACSSDDLDREGRFRFAVEGHSWNVSELGKLPYFEGECGTVYMATLLVWAVAAGFTIACSPYLGFLKTIGLLFGAAILLMLNIWFNPVNPLRLAQWRMVARPTATELELAACCMQEFCRLQKAAPESGVADEGCDR